MSEDWFEKVFPGAKKEFPDAFNPEVGVEYELEFIENIPRPVPVATKGGRAILIPVIEVNCEGKKRSLFLGRKFFAQKILEIQRKYGSLMGLKIKLKLMPKTKKYYEYSIEIVEG